MRTGKCLDCGVDVESRGQGRSPKRCRVHARERRTALIKAGLSAYRAAIGYNATIEHQESCGEDFEPEYKLHCKLTDVRVPAPLRDDDGFLLPEFRGHYTRHLEGREPRPTEELRFE